MSRDLGTVPSGAFMTLQDMTPTPLTAADTTLDSGVGPWVRNPGKAGGVHVELSDTPASSASVVVEYSNTQSPKGAFADVQTCDLNSAGQGWGLSLLNGFIWVRVRVTAISGAGANVTATLGTGV